MQTLQKKIERQELTTSAALLTNYTLFIKLYNGNTPRSEANFFFMEGLTLGLDPGYDAGAFDQGTPLSSRLPQDDQGTNFEINAMSTESCIWASSTPGYKPKSRTEF